MSQHVYRLEVGRRPSQDWPWFVRLARKMPSYKVLEEDGLELHVVETTSVANLAGLYEVVRGWRGWAFLVDGTPATRLMLADLVAQRRKPLKLPAPRPPKLSKDASLNEKVIDSFLNGWSKASWEEMREQLGAGSIDEARKIMKQHYLSVLQKPKRAGGPDPELGF